MALLLPEDQAGLLLTPAMMEQLCAEHETVDTMLEELLRQMSGPLLVPTRGRPPLAEITFHCLDCLDLHYSKPARRTRVVTRQ